VECRQRTNSLDILFRPWTLDPKLLCCSIIEGLILDEEDDTDEGEINPQGPTQQKHLLHLGGEIQKQVQNVEIAVGGRVDGVVSEVAVLQAKLDLVLDSLAVSKDRIRYSLLLGAWSVNAFSQYGRCAEWLHAASPLG
jgi:hypothetical protein